MRWLARTFLVNLLADIAEAAVSAESGRISIDNVVVVVAAVAVPILVLLAGHGACLWYRRKQHSREARRRRRKEAGQHGEGARQQRGRDERQQSGSGTRPPPRAEDARWVVPPGPRRGAPQHDSEAGVDWCDVVTIESSEIDLESSNAEPASPDPRSQRPKQDASGKSPPSKSSSGSPRLPAEAGWLQDPHGASSRSSRVDSLAGRAGNPTTFPGAGARHPPAPLVPPARGDGTEAPGAQQAGAPHSFAPGSSNPATDMNPAEYMMHESAKEGRRNALLRGWPGGLPGADSGAGRRKSRGRGASRSSSRGLSRLGGLAEGQEELVDDGGHGPGLAGGRARSWAGWDLSGIRSGPGSVTSSELAGMVAEVIEIAESPEPGRRRRVDPRPGVPGELREEGG